ncbi:MAG TPA: hypothetical protein VJR50_13640 [Mycobacterium sp.]|nr:hypothetical protein [Mycobacterium sp.]
MITFARRSLLALTVVGILATAFELATESHWNDFQQLIPWFVLAVLAVALVLTALRRRGAQLLARTLILVVLGASIYGVYDHISANYDAGPLDYRYADTWDSLSSSQRFWYAATKQVGPSPPLAPGVLAQTALLLLIAGFLRKPQAASEVDTRLTQPA